MALTLRSEPMTNLIKLNRADGLRVRLEELTTQALLARLDMLSKYRRWLDQEGIPSEVEGWPSEEAYDETNILKFAEKWQGRP